MGNLKLHPCPLPIPTRLQPQARPGAGCDTQSALERGIPRRRFSHFGYPSESESDQEQMDQPIEEPQQPMIYPDIDDLEPLYSDQEEVRPEPTPSLIPSPSGTSAPLLSNPALPDTLSNFPLFSSRAGSLTGLQTIEEPEPKKELTEKFQNPDTAWKHRHHRGEP